MNILQAQFLPGGALIWTCQWGRFEIPEDVYSRSIRLGFLFGRPDYLTEWCRWQVRKEALRGGN